jgi:transposase
MGSWTPKESLDMAEKKQSTEAAVREIRRRTRRKFAPEEKIRIVLEGLRGEQSISELCRREGIAANLYYRAGARTSSRPARSSWPGIRFARRPATPARA